MATIERLPPQNLEAEEAVLGSCLIDPDAVSHIKHVLKPEDFYREKNGWIYEAMLALETDHEPIDVLTIGDRLGNNLDAAGGRAYLLSLINAVPTAVHVEHYAQQVISCANDRRYIALSGQIATWAYEDGGDLDKYSRILDAVKQAEPTGKPVAAVGGPDLDRQMLWTLAMAHKNKMDRQNGGWQAEWPWVEMRKFAAVWRIGQPVGIIAEGGAGKTMVGMEIARHCATNGGNIAYVHTEDEPHVLLMRQIAALSGIPFRHIESATYPDHLPMTDTNVQGVQIQVPTSMLRSIMSIQRGWRGTLWFIDAANLTMPEILYKLSRHEAEQGLIDGVVFDWFLDHRLRDNNNTVMEITRDLQELKGWIADHKSRLLLVTQTGKMGAGKSRLSAYDAFFTSAVAHYCKLVLTLKREREKIDGEAIGPFKPEMEVFIAKANLDKTGAFKLLVRGECFAVTDQMDTLKLGGVYDDD